MNRTSLTILAFACVGFTLSSSAQMTPDANTFIPTDVDFAHPVYANDFTNPATLADWSFEGMGDGEAIIGDGKLTLKNGSGPDGMTNGKPLVFWLKKEMPADFLLEFDFNPRNRKEGLAIVFFNARGRNGESIFDPSLAKRRGNFKQYHSGDLDNYHISYWAGQTRMKDTGDLPASHLRKNHGFHLAVKGKELIESAEQGKPQKVRIYKNGGEIKLMVDDVLALSYLDDGKQFGPVIDKPGWIALRQMAHAGYATYQNFAVYPLTSKDSSK